MSPAPSAANGGEVFLRCRREAELRSEHEVQRKHMEGEGRWETRKMHLDDKYCFLISVLICSHARFCHQSTVHTADCRQQLHYTDAQTQTPTRTHLLGRCRLTPRFSVSYDNLIQTSDTGTLLAQHQLRIITQGAPATQSFDK